MVGDFNDAEGNTHGFLYYGGVFTTIDPPGSLGTEVQTTVNNGLIAGDYVGADGASHGFIGTPKH